MTKEMIFNNKFFNIFVLFINTSVIDAFYKALHFPPSIISMTRLGLNLLFILMIIYYLLTEQIKGKRYLLTIMFIVFSGITILWTIEKIEAAKLYINFAGACCYFVLLACIAYKENIIKALRIYCDVLVVLNILVLAVLPGVGYMGEGSSRVLSGIFLSRSAFVIYMTFSIFIYSYYIKIYAKTLNEKLRVYAMLFIAFALVVLSKSSTGILTAVLFFPLLFMTKKKSGKILLYISIIIGVMLPMLRLSSSVLNNIIYAVFKKTLTFSGRTYIWQFALKNLIKNPIVGSGFDSVRLLFKDRVVPIYDRVAAHCHNGFLNVYMELGLIGLVLFILILIGFFRWTYKLKTNEGKILRAYTIVFIIFNFMEPYSIGNVSLIPLWLPVIYVITLASRKMKETVNE